MVYGGGNVGLMGRMANNLMDAGGQVIGVIPEKINDMGVGHKAITKMYIVSNMHERKALMTELVEGFISLPGGVGTMEELFEIFSWSQLGYHNKPFGVLNTLGYYDTLLQLLDEMTEKGFLSLKHRTSLFAEKEPDVLLQKLMTSKAGHK